jgi:uncharacterized protein YheU (UPF0270 family)
MDQIDRTDQDAPAPVEIPKGVLDAETIRRIAEEFILREGTDYGASEVSLDTKIKQVLAQIERGEAKLFFDPTTDSVTLNPSARR